MILAHSISCCSTNSGTVATTLLFVSRPGNGNGSANGYGFQRVYIQRYSGTRGSIHQGTLALNKVIRLHLYQHSAEVLENHAFQLPSRLACKLRLEVCACGQPTHISWLTQIACSPAQIPLLSFLEMRPHGVIGPGPVLVPQKLALPAVIRPVHQSTLSRAPSQAWCLVRRSAHLPVPPAALQSLQ